MMMMMTMMISSSILYLYPCVNA